MSRDYELMRMRCANINLIICISCLVIISGCGELLKEQMSDTNKARKSTSLAQAQVTHIGKEPLRTFISKRIAYLAENVNSLRHRVDKDKFHFNRDSSGLAVAVSHKGYYLTAHHCVDGSGKYSLLPLRNVKLKKIRTEAEESNDEDSKQYVPASNEKQNSLFLPIRIVWFSKEQDIAIISTDKKCESIFELEDSIPEPNTIVLAGGAWGQHAAGHIISIKSLPGDKEILKEIKHNAPTVSGDSGGPLFSRDGLLYGIHSYGTFSGSIRLTGVKISNIYDHAVSVDASWIQHIIQEDQAKQKPVD